MNQVTQHNTVQQFPLSMLQRAPENVRKSKASDKAFNELKSSILATGLINDLTGYQDGDSIFIVAGGRRLSAHQELAKDGVIDTDTLIGVKLYPKDQAIIVSNAENEIRADQHPLDQCDAFKALLKEGHSLEDIMSTFGYDRRYVEQRLALSKLHSKIKKAFRDEILDLERASLYTQATSKRQGQIIKELGLSASAWDIRRAVRVDGVDSNDRLALFVGKDAYVKAGGKLAEDLFSDKCTFLDVEKVTEQAEFKMDELVSAQPEGTAVGTLEDVNPWMLDTIKGKKAGVPLELQQRFDVLEREINTAQDVLDAFCESDHFIESKEETMTEQIDAMEADLELLDNQIEQYVTFPKKYQAFVKTLFYIGNRGELIKLPGYLDEDAAKAVKNLKAAAKGVASDNAEEAKQLKDSTKPPYSQALIDVIHKVRTEAVQKELVKDHALMYDLLVFEMAIRQLTDTYYTLLLDCDFSANRSKCSNLDNIAHLNLDWVSEEDYDASSPSVLENFKAFQAISKADKDALFGFMVSQNIMGQAKLPNHSFNSYALFEHLADTLNPDYRKSWTPNGEDVFSRMTKSALIEIGTELVSKEFGTTHGKKKKTELIQLLDDVFTNNYEVPDKKKVKNWLPQCFV